jgi:hypothetical protein
MITVELLVTEHDLEQLRVAPVAAASLNRQSTRVDSEEHLRQVVQLVLARAGQATPPGRYVQINSRWTLYPVGVPSIVRPVSDLDRMLDEAGFPVQPRSDSKEGPGSSDPTPMPSGKSGSEPPQSRAMPHPDQPSRETLEALYTEARRAWAALGCELQISVDRPTAIHSSYVLWWTANKYNRGKRIEWYGGVIVLGPYPLPLTLMPVYLGKILRRALDTASLVRSQHACLLARHR